MKWSWQPGGRPSRGAPARLDTIAPSPVQWDVGTGAAILEADDRAPEKYGDSNTGSERLADAVPDGSRPLADCVPPSIPGDAAMPFHGGICSRSESRPPRGLPPRSWWELDVRTGRLERDAPDSESAGRAFRSGVDDGRLWPKTVFYSPAPAGHCSLVVHGEEGLHRASSRGPSTPPCLRGPSATTPRSGRRASRNDRPVPLPAACPCKSRSPPAACDSTRRRSRRALQHRTAVDARRRSVVRVPAHTQRDRHGGPGHLDPAFVC